MNLKGGDYKALYIMHLYYVLAGFCYTYKYMWRQLGTYSVLNRALRVYKQLFKKALASMTIKYSKKKEITKKKIVGTLST